MSRSVVYSVNWAVDVTFETEWIDGKKEELTQSSLMSHENTLMNVKKEQNTSLQVSYKVDT